LDIIWHIKRLILPKLLVRTKKHRASITLNVLMRGKVLRGFDDWFGENKPLEQAECQEGVGSAAEAK
jgi:hypothetical protein